MPEKLIVSWPISPTFGNQLHALFDKSAVISQDQKVMLLNELRRVRESGVDPVMHLVSNFLLSKRPIGRKDSAPRLVGLKSRVQ
jgi:hypothetical protein